MNEGGSLHESSSTKGGQVRRTASALRMSTDTRPQPVQTMSHVPGQAIRLRGSKRKRGTR